MGEVVAVDRGVLPPPVGVAGGDPGHVRRGGGERERQSVGGGINAASGQIESALLEGGAGRLKGGGDGDNDDVHSNNAIGKGDVGLHVAVKPPQAETGDGGEGAGQQ